MLYYKEFKKTKDVTITIYLVIIINLKQGFSIFKCHLYDHKDGSRNISVGRDFMPINIFKNVPLLESFVACFLLCTKSLLQFLLSFGFEIEPRHLMYLDESNRYPSSASTRSFGSSWSWRSCLKIILSLYIPGSNGPFIQHISPLWIAVATS